MREKYVKRGMRVFALLICTVFVTLMVGMPEEDATIFIDEWEQETPLADTLPLDEYYVILAETLVLLPQNIIEQFYADGWGIVITQESLSDMYYKGIYNNVMAVTDGYIKVIWISASEKSIRNSVIHEMGHYIQFTYDFPNKTEEFEAIYEAERKKFVVVGGSAAQARSSSLEYFAEAFQEYFLHPDSLLENTPLTYQYIANYVANF
ncbi:MAG: hypothetical protein IJ326_05165 [Lachnospiraceae bacterium]|nr:hypothetical protein [Lachnospiraceae bacterium]